MVERVRIQYWDISFVKMYHNNKDVYCNGSPQNAARTCFIYHRFCKHNCVVVVVAAEIVVVVVVVVVNIIV